jgi:benzoate-CoA ligase
LLTAEDYAYMLRNSRAQAVMVSAALKAFVKDHLAPYKYPRFIEFVDELPKTATGKIQRFRLRERERTKASAR